MSRHAIEYKRTFQGFVSNLFVLAGFAQAEAKRLFGRDPGLPAAMQQDYLTPWTAARAEKRFLARFAALHAS